ncbi:hypothetical protein SAMN04515620_11593 [Collimonas sp. OK607]|nr:hypothetical protein SAMN04515620_11593 [Collimonas sp. OK607]
MPGYSAQILGRYDDKLVVGATRVTDIPSSSVLVVATASIASAIASIPAPAAVTVFKSVSAAIVAITSIAWTVRPRYTSGEGYGCQRKQNSETFHDELRGNW